MELRQLRYLVALADEQHFTRAAAREESNNLMPPLVEAARAECTEGEIVTRLQTVFGSYREAPVF